MYKAIIILIFSTFFAISAHAGFWSSVAGGVVANSLTGSSSGSPGKDTTRRGVDHEQTDEMKIQQALYGLGHYNGKLDGNLNTMDSRLAIKSFQKLNNSKENGILIEDNRQHLLYIHELYELLVDEKTSKDKRYKVYDEIDGVKKLMETEG